ALLPPFGRDVRLVRPVVELHLRDSRDLADLAEIELELVQMLGDIVRFEELGSLAVDNSTSLGEMRQPPLKVIPLFFEFVKRERLRSEASASRPCLLQARPKELRPPPRRRRRRLRSPTRPRARCWRRARPCAAAPRSRPASPGRAA